MRAAAPFGAGAGQSLWIEVTASCNWSCQFCYNPWRPGDRHAYPQAVSLEELTIGVRRLIRRVNFDYVALSGGEPLLYRRLDELVRWLSGEELYSILTTNGSKLSRERVGTLRAAGLRSVQVSLMSLDEETHNELAGANSWRSAVGGVLHALDVDLDVAVVFTATRRNLAHLSPTVVFLAELGVGRLIVNELQFGGSAFGNSADLAVSSVEFRAAVAEAVSVADRAGVQVVPVPPLAFDESDPGRPWTRWSVTPSGELKLCNLSTRTLGPLTAIPDETLDALVDDLTGGRIASHVDSVDTCSCFDRRMIQLNRPTAASSGTPG